MLSKFPNERGTITMQVIKLRLYLYRHSADTKYNHFELGCKETAADTTPLKLKIKK